MNKHTIPDKMTVTHPGSEVSLWDWFIPILNTGDDIRDVVVQVIYLLYSTVHRGCVVTDKRSAYVLIQIQVSA